MNPRRFLGCAVIGVLIGGGCSLFLAHKAQGLEAKRATVRTAETNLTARLADANARLAKARQSRPENRHAARAKEPTPARDNVPPPQRTMAQMYYDRDTPALQNLQLAVQRGRFAVTFSPFYRARKMSPADIEKFEQILLQRHEHMSDLDAATLGKGINRADPTYQKMNQQVTLEYQSAQRELLGETGFKELEDYERLNPVRESVRAMAAAAAMAGSPFDRNQAEQLTSALASAIPDYRAGGYPNMHAIDWSRVHTAATTILSPMQLTILETTETRSGFGGRFQLQMSAAMSAAVKSEARAK